MGGKGRKENGREEGNGGKKRGLRKRCQEEEKRGKETRRKRTQREDRFSPGGAWSVRDVSAPPPPPAERCEIAGRAGGPGSVGRRSLGGCESLGLWPPAQPAPAAGQGGNCPAYPGALCKAARAGPGRRLSRCPPRSSRGPSAAR